MNFHIFQERFGNRREDDIQKEEMGRTWPRATCSIWVGGAESIQLLLSILIAIEFKGIGMT